MVIINGVFVHSAGAYSIFAVMLGDVLAIVLISAAIQLGQRENVEGGNMLELVKLARYAIPYSLAKEVTRLFVA